MGSLCFNRKCIVLQFSQGRVNKLTHKWCHAMHAVLVIQEQKFIKFIRKNLSLIASPDPNVPLLSISRKSDTRLYCFDGLPPWAKPGKMTIVDTGCWPKAISPLWPNSPQRCKHYMEEWPTDRPQRLQSEGQWFVQQPIRGLWVWLCECVCVRVGAHAIGVGWWGTTVVNWTTQFQKGLKSDCHKG